MNPIRQIVATSFMFHQSIPHLWAVKELLRVSKYVEKEEEYQELTAPEQVSLVITELLEDNPEIPKHQVYGLTAVQLYRKKMLQDSYPIVCTLVKDRSEEGEKLDEILSNNHRYFQYKAQDIDPLRDYYGDRGSVVYITDKYRAPSVPISIIQGLLGRVTDSHHSTRDWEDGTDPHLSWFLKTVHRIARRVRLTPYWWARKDPQGIQDKKAFEGYMRVLVPRFREESEDKWKHYLKEALRTEFPSWEDGSIDNFIIRIVQQFGPPPPRTHQPSKKKVQLVTPDTGYIHPSSYI